MNLQIKITKDVLRRSAGCNPEMKGGAPSNCAIALAVRDIFPDATVGFLYIRTHGFQIEHPAIAFIQEFDALEPDERLCMPEFSFTLPPEVVDAVNIDDIHASKTLEVV